MLIDWFTVGAQMLNFLVLVWLMKRFLYKPILQAIDEREKRIAEELDDADKKKAEAQKERDEFKQKNQELDQQRTSLLSKATDEVKAERQRLLEEARKAADDLSSKLKNSMRNEENNLHQAISRQTQQEVFAISRKVLMDITDTSLEERLCGVFIRRLRDMDAESKATLAESLKNTPHSAVVRSAFDLTAEQRAAIQNALNETFSVEIQLRFDSTPELICGIELITNGQKIAWSIYDYMSSLEKGAEELLREKNELELKASSDLIPQIAKRAYELYEQQGQKSNSAMQNWSQAEQEMLKVESKTEVKADSESAVKADRTSDTKNQ